MRKGFSNFMLRYIGFYILWRVLYHAWILTSELKVELWVNVALNIIVTVAFTLILVSFEE